MDVEAAKSPPERNVSSQEVLSIEQKSEATRKASAPFTGMWYVECQGIELRSHRALLAVRTRFSKRNACAYAC